MYRRVLAFDFDGTLAEGGVVPSALQAALEQLHRDGYVLFMVTGRRFEDAELGSLKDILAGIVWENGAVLYHIATDEVYLPFGHIDQRLVEAMEAAGVLLEYGRAIVSTRMPHDETAWDVLYKWGGDAVVVRNKGAVRILPSGATKGAGLERLLGLCGFSPRNLVSFGDGESDLSLLQLGEVGVAVANAVPRLKEAADLVTARPGPAGVLEALETHWLSGGTSDTLRATIRECLIPLGKDETGTSVSLSAADLAGGNLGVFGDSGSGKSWVAGLLVEGMHHAGYQVLPLPRHKRFYFRDQQVFLGVEAASLFEFLHCLRDLPIESLAYHHARGDFVRWVDTALGEGMLADHLHKLAQRPLEGGALREALVQRVADHYEELHALGQQPLLNGERA